MIDVLRDGAWQGIGAILALAATMLVYVLQRRRKEIAFGTVASGDLLSVADEIAKRVDIKFDGEKITNLKYVVLGIKNSGDEPIRESDYSQPISIAFEGKGRVLAAAVQRQHPRSLSIQLKVGDWDLSIAPTLLNPGDYVTIKVGSPEF